MQSLLTQTTGRRGRRIPRACKAAVNAATAPAATMCGPVHLQQAACEAAVQLQQLWQPRACQAAVSTGTALTATMCGPVHLQQAACEAAV
jgi:hypothetical protein